MLDGILKGKFYTKCKSAIKVIRKRLELIKRKRNAIQKHLKNDVADLLRNGHGVKAFSRTEGLLIELTISSRYDSVDQFCCCILKHLSKMTKQKECPEECREAVPSLMLAAARFADLPELRDLRSIFARKYANSLEAYANQEFVEKLKAMTATKDMKLQLLQDIAMEFSIEWDSKVLEQKPCNPPASEQQACSQNSDQENKQKLQKSRDETAQKMDQKTRTKRREDDFRRDIKDLPCHGKKEVTENNAISGGDNRGKKSHENQQKKNISVPSIGYNGHQNNSKSERTLFESKAEENKPLSSDLKAGETETCLEPKPRSVRSRRTRPPVTEKVDRNGVPSQEAAKQGLKDGNDQKNEEEMKMDKLLLHYSTKQSTFEVGKVEAALRQPTSEKAAFGATSLPPQQISPVDRVKGLSRASSLQPTANGLLHPKLPDYDDFVAKLQALRGQ